MNISELSKNEQYVRHLAGFRGTSPVESEMKVRASIAVDQAQISVLGKIGNLVSSTLSIGAVGTLLYPLAITNVRATILGATPEKVYGACGDSAKFLSGVAQGIASFADTWGIPEASVSNLFSSISDLFSVNNSATSWFGEGATNPAYSANPEEYLQSCRVGNYLSSVNQVIQWARDNPLFPASAALCMGVLLGVAAITTQFDINKCETKINDNDRVISERYHQILDTIKEMQSEAKNNTETKKNLLKLAEGIVENKTEIRREIDAVGVRRIGTYEAAEVIHGCPRKITKSRYINAGPGLVQPIIKLANEILVP